MLLVAIGGLFIYGIHQETFDPEQEQYAERNKKFAKARADSFKASPPSNYESN